MKYYIKATNKETNKSMVMSVPVFTNKKKAQEWADKFVKSMPKIAEVEVVKEK